MWRGPFLLVRARNESICENDERVATVEEESQPKILKWLSRVEKVSDERGREDH